MANTKKTTAKKTVSDCSGKKSNGGVSAKSSTKKSGTTRCKKSATTK